MKLKDLVVRSKNEIVCPNCVNGNGVPTGLVFTGYFKNGEPRVEPCGLCRGATTATRSEIEEYIQAKHSQM